MSTDTYIIGYASGNAAQDHSCCMGPIIMEHSDRINNATWLGQIYPTDDLRKLDAVANTFTCCYKLSQHTMSLAKDQKNFVVIGGDHSAAIGTWSGVASAKQDKIGMIWIDAHLDAHTPASSHTKNIHGMALATLLGHGPTELNNLCHTGAKIDSKHLVIIGARDYEPEEQKLLMQLGVRIFHMDKVKEKELSKVFEEALNIASSTPNGFGISIDIDGLDANFAPATALPSTPGIIPAELTYEFKTTLQQHRSKLLGLEITEFFPGLDKNHQTEQVIADLINAAYGG